jgi:hypothetical protein
MYMDLSGMLSFYFRQKELENFKNIQILKLLTTHEN